MFRFPVAWLALVTCALTIVSCEGPARIMEDDEEDYIGRRAAGAATFDRLVSGAVEKLMSDPSAAITATGKLSVAVLPVENASSEDLGDWQEQIYEIIATSINQSDRFVTINRRFVESALRETRIRQEQLFIPRHRRAFLDVLETTDNPAQLLLFPKLTSGTTAGASVKQRNYILTLDLVEVKTGRELNKVSERLRKAYED